MLQHILVPLDGSSYAASAIPVAARLARATGGSVTLLQSVPYPLETGESFTEPPVSVKGAPEADHARVVDYLTRMAASDGLSDVSTDIDVTDRQPVQAILSCAQSHQADIIVMRSSGEKGMGRWISGSIAREVGRHSPVPVLVLRTGEGMVNLSPGGIRPVVVLVALDGSSQAEAALAPAAQLSAALSAPAPGVLHLVQVLHFPTMEAGGHHEQGVEARQWAEAEAQVYLRSIEQRLRAGGFASLHLSITSSVVTSTDVVHTVAQKYILVDQSGRLSCYPHKRSMLSGGSAECSVTDLIQPLTYLFPEEIRRPRGDVGGNRSASPEPLYDSELRPFSVMVGWGAGSA